MNDVTKTAWAGVKSNSDFVCIETYSGYRSANLDPKGVRHLLDPDASDDDLGSALLDSLARSRFVLPAPRKDVWIHPEAQFDMDLFDYEKSSARTEAWKAAMMSRYGYKTKQALFKGMKSCTIESQLGKITISPMHHAKLEAWNQSGADRVLNVEIPADSNAAEVGAALRLALSRCTE